MIIAAVTGPLLSAIAVLGASLERALWRHPCCIYNPGGVRCSWCHSRNRLPLLYTDHLFPSSITVCTGESIVHDTAEMQELLYRYFGGIVTLYLVFFFFWCNKSVWWLCVLVGENKIIINGKAQRIWVMQKAQIRQMIRFNCLLPSTDTNLRNLEKCRFYI